MTFSAPGLQGRAEVTYGDASVFVRLLPQVDGIVVTPTGTPTFAVYPPRSTTALTTGNCTTDSTRIRATFNVSSASDYPLDVGYRCVFTFVSGGLTYRRTVLFDVVRCPLNDACPINLNHLKGFNVEVDGFIDQQYGTDASAIAAATELIVTPAWEDVLLYVSSQGFRPALVASPELLVPMARARGYMHIIRHMTRVQSDLRVLLMEEARKAWEFATAHTQLVYNLTDNNEQQQVRAWKQPRIFTGRDPVREGAAPLVWSVVKPGGDE